MKFFILMVLVHFTSGFAYSQDLPVKTVKGSDPIKPLILYLSGDGGWNSFSTGFIDEWNKRGYSVVALNSKSYFWKRKEPIEFATDMEGLLRQYINSWKVKSVVLIGYSFGADVMPFLVNRLSPFLHDKTFQVILMSPSEKTDFEVHLLGMMGYSKSSGQSVVSEINKINKPVMILAGSNENDFPFRLLSSKNVLTQKLPGGHHYDGNFNELISLIQKECRF